MARWPNENAYDAEIRAAMQSAGITGSYLPVVKGMIAVESRFVPTAIRQEPTYRCPLDGSVGDASRGLMQILHCTARGLGFTGTVQELFDPATNLRLGIRYLVDRLTAHSGDTWAAVSAYNNGHGRRATMATTVCLARDTAGRCIRSFTAQPGEFLNQPYVDAVQDAARYFGDTTGGAQPLPPVTIPGSPDPAPAPADGPDPRTVLAVAGAIVAGALLVDNLMG